MHEPARRGHFALIKSFAVEPESVAGMILHEVIVARRPLRAPPLAGDALRTLRANDGVRLAPPAKTFGWPFRNDGDHVFRRFLLRQQKQGARARFVRGGPLGGRAGRNGQRFGPFWQMACDRREATYVAGAKPLPEA